MKYGDVMLFSQEAVRDVHLKLLLPSGPKHP